MATWASIAATVAPPAEVEPPPAVEEPREEVSREEVSREEAGLRQIEYYFGDENWRRDRYLRGLAVDGVVPLSSLVDFPKIKALGLSAEELAECCAASDVVRVVGGGLGRVTRELRAVVLDANALISGGHLESVEVYTTAGVVAEIRDAESRRRLDALEYKLNAREPSAAALAAVAASAKESGDLRSLSPVDIGVIALTYDLELEHRADSRPPAALAPRREEAASERSRILAGPSVSGVSATVEDDGEGWEGPGCGGDGSVCAAACATTDFAMQNVLLHMGLGLVAADGRRVERTRRFVVRCSACFAVETQHPDRLFCARCGSHALRKTPARLDGSLPAPRLQRRPRGAKFPIPKPNNAKTGTARYQGDLLLREDQLLAGIWKHKNDRDRAKAKADAKTSVFGPDVSDALAALDLKPPATLAVGYGRRNPNATKGRERRGKKKT
mmetsp:Transcript_17728/g.55528  ORF Transcript_17728/g.55528 Transcript_17728/m.55528 type:complete len:444 (-) Transcript_17728:25-1356(-)